MAERAELLAAVMAIGGLIWLVKVRPIFPAVAFTVMVFGGLICWMSQSTKAHWVGTIAWAAQR